MRPTGKQSKKWRGRRHTSAQQYGEVTEVFQNSRIVWTFAYSIAKYSRRNSY